MNGQAFCENCGAGTFQRLQECPACPAGWRSLGGTAACNLCAPGKYAAADGASECDECEKGTSSSADRTACVECPPGWISAGGSACEACPTGFAANNAQTRCVECPSGEYYAFSPSASRLKCRPCPREGAQCDKSQIDPTPGWWSNTSVLSRADSPHARHARRLAHVPDGEFLVDRDKDFVFDNTDFRIFECRHELACTVVTLERVGAVGAAPGGGPALERFVVSNGTSASCATDASDPYGYDPERCLKVFNCTAGHEGALCARCSADYYPHEGVCVPCAKSVEDGGKGDDGLAKAGEYSGIALGLFAAMACAVLLLKYRGKKWFAVLQKHHLAPRGKAGDGDDGGGCAARAREALHQLSSYAARGRLMDVIGEKCRCLVSFAQVVTYLYQSVSYCIKFPATAKAAYRGMMSAAAVFSLDPTFRMPCYLKSYWDGYRTKQNIALLLPLGLVGAVMLWAGVERAAMALRDRKARAAAEEAGKQRRKREKRSLRNMISSLTHDATKRRQAERKKEEEQAAAKMWSHMSHACFILDLFCTCVCPRSQQCSPCTARP